MNCEIFNILYLRANTEVACNCGSGEKVNLGWAGGEEDWSASGLFSNLAYRHMAKSFREGKLPWADVCRRCVFLRPNEPFYDGLAEKRLQRVHLEPSLACALRCPGCSRIHQVKERKGPMFLPVPVYRRVLRSLADEGYEVGHFYFCGQGEPLSHPHLQDLIAATRQHFPASPIGINTNGNYRYKEVFSRGIKPDKLIVSVDGLHQESYEKYRINGNVALALDFMRDAKRDDGPVPVVEWKYILFRYNDSDEELIAAQHRAEDLGIDSLQFVITHTPEKSERFTIENVDELPIVSPLAYPETTPHLYFKRPLAKPLTPTHTALMPDFPGAEKFLCSVDEVRCWAGRVFVRGWAMGRDGAPPRALRFRIGDRAEGRARLGIPRQDVLAAYPAQKNASAGFNGATLLPGIEEKESVAIDFTCEDSDGEAHRFSIKYDFAATGAEIFNANCP